MLRRRHILQTFLSLALLFFLAISARANESNSPKEPSLFELGQKIYTSTCADCHGKQGEGVEGIYARPLVGDDSLGQLGHYITSTMPEGDAESCVGDEAKAVAEYIHQTFYSEEAQLRNRPPRVLLSHLTANQLRQSLADLYGHFYGATYIKDELGLAAKYLNGKGWKDTKIERIDPVIDFDWGTEGPGEEIDGSEFHVHWTGGIKANETGPHEFIIRSTSSFKAYLGHHRRVLIDNHVQSGGRTEFHQTVNLTAGRVYSFKLDLTQRKRKTEQPPVSISVSWIPPGGTEQIIPQRNYRHGSIQPTFTLQTKLPPDDHSYGFDRGLRVDPQWDSSTTAAALEFAQAVSDELWPEHLKRNQKKDGSDREKLRTFLLDFARVAFRGPADEPSIEFYIDQQLAATEDNSEALKRSIVVMLKSPRFLYPALDSDRSPSQRAANQLALTLFDSLPSDKWLLDTIDKNHLEKPDQIRYYAKKMLDDYRARGKVQQMLYKWLNLHEFSEMSKDPKLYPEFNPELVTELKNSLDALLEEIVWSEQSDYRQFFTADWVYTSPKLRDFYGESWEPREEFTLGYDRSVTAKETRFGVLSHPYLLSGLSYRDATSPIHRGVFLTRNMFGRTLKPPMEAFAPLSADLHPDMTTRQRVELQTQGASCQVCHTKINGLGFALENFDAVGRYRESEGDKPINSVGQYITRDGETVLLKGARSLAEHLANSPDAHRSFINRSFQYLVKQPVAAYGHGLLDELVIKFENSNYNVRELITEIAVIAALGPVETSPGT
ncbi:DUF1588 domain-containing protein [Calycomorphotria hydatis]|uniref:PA14 domain protein n=1 Tax=Calycomorphotria hydatis TaxID=2528027 RepID=A0A517T4D6_9PLAN|nr:DUF1588 domain-containing protein [Calycomorphotria hydatis]QDT63232.1 PA14 domain protein [Calycomorphotria hydatis]